MSLADKIFVSMCEDIIMNGTSTEGQNVRPHYDDGTPAFTIKQFGIVNRYDLRKEFPAITLRKTYIKSAIDEILWIYQKKSNNIHDLNSHIWDRWADENGSIGKAYGYQVGKSYIHHKQKLNNELGGGEIGFRLDQIDAVLYDLKHNPFSRRIMINSFLVNLQNYINLS